MSHGGGSDGSAPGIAANRGRSVANDHLGPDRGQVVQHPGQPERRDEGQRRVRLIHQVEALLVHPGTQDLQDPLPVAQLVERVGRLAGFCSR